MRVLVTGGAGFIGSHLVDRLLAEGREVRILDSLDPQVHPQGRPEYLASEAELVVADVRDRDAVRAALEGVDRVVHLAAAVGVGQSMYEIERYTSVNALGAAVLLEQAIGFRERLQKVVVASSMSVYGEGLYRCPAEDRELAPQPREEEQLRRRAWELRCPGCGAELEPLPTPETKPLAPTSIYAVGKRDHEEMVLAWGRAYGVQATALRFFNVYGPRQSLSNPYTGVAAIFASRLLNGRPPLVFEDGRQTRDFVHVSDIVAGIGAALEPGKADLSALNLASGQPVSVLEVAETLGRELGVELEPEIRNGFRAGDIRHCVADIARAGGELGFAPRVRFQEGMTELAGWLAGRQAADHVEQATEALVRHGLAG
ncbi:MAG: NAD-dependent epimerase/dehydratase family protein [Gaiellaceae bacterium]